MTGDDIYGRKISIVTNAEREMRKKMRIFTEMIFESFCWLLSMAYF